MDPYQAQIASYLKMGLNLTAIHKIINNQLPKPITYQALKYFVDQDQELTQLRQKKKIVWLSVSIYAMNNAMNAYKPYHRSLEIFSGSLLAKRRNWQQVKNQLPAHTYLLVAPLGNTAPTRMMLNLGRLLREEGVSVFVLSVC